MKLENSACDWSFKMKFEDAIGMDNKFLHQKFEVSSSQNVRVIKEKLVFRP